jgi:thiamine-phosphate pyrophosphorylase
VLRCYITDRRQLGSRDALMACIARNLAAGIEWIQIREKDLSARELFELVQRVRELPDAGRAKILVNTRVDVALAAGAAGAHLPDGSPEPRHWSSIAPRDFLIGVSCHDVEGVRAAEREGANYVLYGPVFEPRSKSSDVPPRGLAALGEAARAVHIPVLALGGITKDNTAECVSAGAAGVAAISLFQTC